MDIDVADVANRFGELIEAALVMLQGLIWVIIIGAGFLFNRRKQQQAPSRSAPAPGRASTGTYRDRRPIDPANQPGFGNTYTASEPVPSPYAAGPPRGGADIQAELDRRSSRSGSGNPASASTDDSLSFGSLFDQRDDQPREQRREENKWGFDESEWGSAFGPKKSSEPTITQGQGGTSRQ